MREIIFPKNLFLRALFITAVIFSVTDALMFYVIWSGKTRITPLFVILVIIITMVPLAIDLWVHIFRYLGKGGNYSASG
ncbi:MAG: hypothetical protein ACXV5F_06285 [Halobacteriota archaeon]